VAGALNSTINVACCWLAIGEARVKLNPGSGDATPTALIVNARLPIERPPVKVPDDVGIKVKLKLIDAPTAITIGAAGTLDSENPAPDAVMPVRVTGS
jgi:hypothetical protein